MLGWTVSAGGDGWEPQAPGHSCARRAMRSGWLLGLLVIVDPKALEPLGSDGRRPGTVDS